MARNPAVAMDASGSGLVVWEQRPQAGGEYEIHARGYRSDGSNPVKVADLRTQSNSSLGDPA